MKGIADFESRQNMRTHPEHWLLWYKSAHGNIEFSSKTNKLKLSLYRGHVLLSLLTLFMELSNNLRPVFLKSRIIFFTSDFSTNHPGEMKIFVDYSSGEYWAEP